MRLSKTRKLEAAGIFFKQARATVGPSNNPEKISTDVHDSYPKAIRKTFGLNVEYRTNRYENNLLEQTHRKIKQRYYPLKNFKSFEAASRVYFQGAWNKYIISKESFLGNYTIV